MKKIFKLCYLFMFLFIISCSSNFNPNENINNLFNMVNAERRKAGKSDLIYDSKISEAAYIRAKEISGPDSFSHHRPNGTLYVTVFDELHISYSLTVENIAGGHRNANEVMKDWMNSKGHKSNILSNKYKKIGIAVYNKNGTLYWVQLFSN
ncbi:CAP domain-containing protein [Brachyspira sp.]|uniref:CAP domain-containing protein n=1 Tax=Brachyspira sp. TaxID=1977261 RepID=UPI002609870F|nr:CAP domain-containing protein [Brachyspira sp.]